MSGQSDEPQEPLSGVDTDRHLLALFCLTALLLLGCWYPDKWQFESPQGNTSKQPTAEPHVFLWLDQLLVNCQWCLQLNQPITADSYELNY